jgi:hypothetical protein
VFLIAVGMDVLTGVLALLVLKKMRANYIKGESKSMLGVAPAPAE